MVSLKGNRMNDKIKMEEIGITKKPSFEIDDIEKWFFNWQVYLRDKSKSNYLCANSNLRYRSLIEGTPSYSNEFSHTIQNLSGQRIDSCEVDEPKSTLRFSDGFELRNVEIEDAIIETLLGKGEVYSNKNVSEGELLKEIGEAGFTLDDLKFIRIEDVNYAPRKEKVNLDMHGYSELQKKGAITTTHFIEGKRYRKGGRKIAVYDMNNNVYLFELSSNSTIERKILEEKELEEDIKRTIKKDFRLKSDHKIRPVLNHVKDSIRETLNIREKLDRVSILDHMIKGGKVELDTSYLECKIMPYGNSGVIYGCKPINGVICLRKPDDENMLIRSPPNLTVDLSFLNDSRMMIKKERDKIDYIS